MKQLYSRLLLFGFVACSIYGAYIVLIAHVFNSDYLFRLPPEKTVLIVGNSHTACDINDTLTPAIFNLSQPADAIGNSYDKLIKFLPLNPQIHTVVLGCSEGDITQRSEDDEDITKSMKYHVITYFYLMPPGEIMHLLMQNPKEVLKGLISLPRSKSLLAWRIHKSQATLKDLDIGRYQYIGGEINFEKEKKKFEKQNYDVSEVSPRQIDYLHKIEDLCKSRNIKLIFLRTPEHKIYIRKNEKIFLDLMHAQFADVLFKDCVDMNFPDSCFQDHDHLNYNGANRFTDTVVEYLKGN